MQIVQIRIKKGTVWKWSANFSEHRVHTMRFKRSPSVISSAPWRRWPRCTTQWPTLCWYWRLALRWSVAPWSPQNWSPAPLKSFPKQTLKVTSLSSVCMSKPKSSPTLYRTTKVWCLSKWDPTPGKRVISFKCAWTSSSVFPQFSKFFWTMQTARKINITQVILFILWWTFESAFRSLTFSEYRYWSRVSLQCCASFEPAWKEVMSQRLQQVVTKLVQSWFHANFVDHNSIVVHAIRPACRQPSAMKLIQFLHEGLAQLRFEQRNRINFRRFGGHEGCPRFRRVQAICLPVLRMNGLRWVGPLGVEKPVVFTLDFIFQNNIQTLLVGFRGIISWVRVILTELAGIVQQRKSCPDCAAQGWHVGIQGAKCLRHGRFIHHSILLHKRTVDPAVHPHLSGRLGPCCVHFQLHAEVRAVGGGRGPLDYHGNHPGAGIFGHEQLSTILHWQIQQGGWSCSLKNGWQPATVMVMQSCMLILVCNNFRGQHAVNSSTVLRNSHQFWTGDSQNDWIILQLGYLRLQSRQHLCCIPAILHTRWLQYLSMCLITLFYLHYISLPCAFKNFGSSGNEKVLGISARMTFGMSIGAKISALPKAGSNSTCGIWTSGEEIQRPVQDLPLILYLSRSLVNGAKSSREDHGPRNRAMFGSTMMTILIPHKSKTCHTWYGAVFLAGQWS